MGVIDIKVVVLCLLCGVISDSTKELYELRKKDIPSYTNSSFHLQLPLLNKKEDLVQIFENGSSRLSEDMFERLEHVDVGKYRKRHHGGRGAYDYEYGGGGPYGAWGVGSGGGDSFGGHKKGGKHNKHHYNPGQGVYGGGGPIKFNPKGHTGGGGGVQVVPLKPNYGSSYIPSHILPHVPNHVGGGGIGGGGIGHGHGIAGGGGSGIGGGGGGPALGDGGIGHGHGTGVGVNVNTGVSVYGSGGSSDGGGGGHSGGHGGGGVLIGGVSGGGGYGVGVGGGPGIAAGNGGGGGARPRPDVTVQVGYGGDLSELVVTIVLCDHADRCRPYAQCASYTSEILRSKERNCFQARRQLKGMCCEVHYPAVSETAKHLGPYNTETVQVPDISQGSLQTAAAKGFDYLSTYLSIENQLLEQNAVVERGTSSYGHLQFFQTTLAMLQISKDNLLTIKATTYIQETYFLTKAEAAIGLQGYDFGGTVFERTCPVAPKCDGYSRYRTLDGSCNNPSNSKIGQSSTPLLRLLPPDYADGIWVPRVRRDGSPLPSARFISLNLIPDVNTPDPRYSHMLTQFGQFVDHDMTHVPMFRFSDLQGIECCSNQVQTDISHPACFPIELPPNDPFQKNAPCMNFVRSMIAPRLDCSFGHADQLNQVTHWLDSSQIYGSTYEQAEALREFSGGRLRVQRENGGRDFLPEGTQADERVCNQGRNNAASGHCFVAGDKRVNEQIALTSLQTIFLREHNRIAFELSILNPLWDDEILYQETRRIVNAEYQHIIYNEFLPLLIGRNYMVTFGILPRFEKHSHDYDPSVDGRVSNAFATAAYRLHTLVQGNLLLQSGKRGRVGRLVLRDFFNNPNILPEPGVLDYVTEGLLTQPMQKFDNFLTTELRDHLFETSESPGLDLAALNIQRGRDHGLPSYNEYRDLCRLGKAREFSDLAPIIHPKKIPQLERIYGNVDDIDLWVGGIHETPLPGAIVGPTFACIIGDQFVRSKRGDRYFYDVGKQEHSFTSPQLNEIRSASLSRIICDNTDDIRFIQPLAFHLPNRFYNPIFPCGSSSIPRVDLRAWRDNQ